MMELKTYQLTALEAFSRWLEVLKEAQNESDTAVGALRGTGVDISILNEAGNYPRTAWQKLKEEEGLAESAGEYINRTDGALIARFRISASKCRQAAVKPCSPLPLWNASIGRPD